MHMFNVLQDCIFFVATNSKIFFISYISVVTGDLLSTYEFCSVDVVTFWGYFT